MIPSNLIIFLVIVDIIYFIIILLAIKKQKMPIKSSIIWLSFGAIMLVCIFSQSILLKICNFLNIEKVSNFLLFCGFMALLILTFDLYKINNQLKQKIIKLGQEVAILKNETDNK